MAHRTELAGAIDTMSQTRVVLQCSFCSKQEGEVRKLIAGPSAFICDECIEVCKDIIANDTGELPPPTRERVEPNPVEERPVGGHVIPCALCETPTPFEDGILVLRRGLLCPGCVGEIEAALAEQRPQDS